MIHHNLRPAITMIELIFAMVIMGIALMSAPMLISQANKSGYVSMQQEGIAAAASHLSFVLTQHWDEANTAQVPRATILGADTSAAINLNAVGALVPYRAGTPLTGTHRTFIDNTGALAAATVAPGGRDGAEANPNDIDDYDGTVATLRALNNIGNGADDYIDKNMNMNTAVQYADDAPTNAPNTFNHNGIALTYNIPNTRALPALPVGANSSNIKWISVTLNEGAPAQAAGISELSKSIILHAFSCNIGAYRLRETAP